MNSFFKKKTSNSSQEIRPNVIQQHFETRETVIQTTFRSKSVSFSSQPSSGSLSAAANKETPKRPPLNIDRFNTTLTTEKDAKPINLPTKKINLNYESPYKRESRVYRSFGSYPSTSQQSNSFLSNNNNSATKYTTSTPQLSTTTTTPDRKKISVKTTGRFYDNSGLVPVYKTSSSKRGEVLIINNILFNTSEYRSGAELDETNLDELFQQMGFNVKTQRNLTKSKMANTLNKFSKKSALKHSDIAIIIIMSHGTNRDTLGGYTEIFGSDDESMNVETILKLFTNQNCPYMADKPKIFIFQCCRGTEAFIRKDAKSALIQSPELYKDMLIAYSTLPGFASHRDPTTGTWYIQTICDVFSQHAHELPVEELLKIVNDRLSTKHNNIIQTSAYENRGFKKCYLHPITTTKKK